MAKAIGGRSECRWVGSILGRVGGAAVLGLGLLLGGCAVFVGGPSSAFRGAIVTFEVVVEADSNATDVTVWMAVDVPVGWVLTSATWEGEIDGDPDSGSLSQGAEASAPDCLGDRPLEAGFQRLLFFAGPFDDIDGDDRAVVALSFDTSGGGLGRFDLFFHGGGVRGDCPSGIVDETPVGPVEFTSGVGTSIEIRATVMEIPTLRALGLLALVGLLAWTALRRVGPAA